MKRAAKQHLNSLAFVANDCFLIGFVSQFVSYISILTLFKVLSSKSYPQ